MLLTLLIALLLISCVAQLALYIVAPRNALYTGDLSANGRVDEYGYWGPGDSGDVPLLPPLADAAIAAPPEPTSSTTDATPQPEESAPLVVIPQPSADPVIVALVEPSATPTPTSSPSPVPSAAPPTRTATATVTATRTPIRAPQQISPTSQPTQAVTTSPTSTPISNPGGPVVPPTATNPPAATRTPQPTGTATTPPTQTATATRTPVPGTATSTPVPPPTSTPTLTPTPVITLGFAEPNPAVSETDGSVSVVVNVVIQPSTGTRGTVQVNYATIAGGSATAGQDYTATSGTLTFGPTDTTQSFMITILADNLKENPETVLLQLSNQRPSTVSIAGGDTATLTIYDSNAPPLVRFVGGAQTVSEAAGNVAIPIGLSGPSVFPVTVPYTISGSASASDHTLSNGTITIPPGATRANLRFRIVDDRIDEDDETLIVTLGNPNNASLGTPGAYTLTIVDNDTARVAVSPVTLTLSEAAPNTAQTYAVVLESQPVNPVTVAVAPDVQVSVDKPSLTFTATNWSTPQIVSVRAVDDKIDEDGNNNASTHPGFVTHTVTSGDPKYNRIVTDRVQANITDNDTVGLNVVLASKVPPATTTEGGGTITFNVWLNSQPTANVRVPVVSGDITEGVLDKSFLDFTPATWNAPQTVTVTGVNDFVDDGNIAYTITVGATTVPAPGSDPLYNGTFTRTVNLTNIDDDTAGVTVSALSGTQSTEAGGGVTFTVVLDSEPLAPVTIPVASSAIAEGVVSPASLTFTPAKDVPGGWNMPQTVTVTGVDDFVDDGDIAYTVQVGPALSGDLLYNGTANGSLPVTRSLTNIDDDTAGVTVANVSGTQTTEAGGGVTFTVVLDSEPTQPTVQISLSSSDPTEGALSAVGLTFTPANWNMPQTVTVAGVDDFVDDGDIAYTVQVGPALSGDLLYNGTANGSLPVTRSLTNIDDDTAGVTVTPQAAPLALAEAGGTMTYTLALTSEPTANVVITATADVQLLVGGAVTQTLTFTPGNWNVAQTVTVAAVDDQIDEDGDNNGSTHPGLVTHTIASADPIYAALSVASVSAAITDDDSAGIMVAPLAGAVAEGGDPTPVTFSAVLTSQPTANVLITASPDAQLLVDGLPSQALTFTPLNWNTPQVVTVTAVDDLMAEEVPQTGAISFAVASTDMIYAAQAIGNYTATITDNDPATLIVSAPSGLTTSEAGAAITFTVRLASQPLADVSVPVASSATAEGVVDQPTLTFTSANWNAPQTVTITGVDDFIADGDIAYPVAVGPTTSLSPIYTGVVGAPISLINLDNDSAGVIITPVTPMLALAEAGGTSTYTVVLGSQPLSPVTVTASADAQLTVDGLPAQTLTFDATTWNLPQTVTVAAVNDQIDEDGDNNVTPHSGLVTHSSASVDPTYNGIVIASVGADITDDDTAGAVVTPQATPLLLAEGSALTATYDVVLTSQPTANVVITASADAKVLVNGLATQTLTFTPGNWNVAQTVTVAAVDDQIDEDGDNNVSTHPGLVTHTIASADPIYSALSVASVSASIIDNDTAGITAGALTNAVAEGGATDTYSLVLTSQPTADVVITATADLQLRVDGLASQTLTFTPANWSVAQTITVSAVDDAVAEGPHSGAVSLSVASADPIYNLLTLVPYTATIIDNDPAGLVVSLPSGPSTTEAGGTVTFTVALLTQPAVTVTVPVASGDTTEGSVSPASLTFTTADWNLPQTVTVTGADDLLLDGPVAYSVQVGPTSGASAIYNALAPSLVSLTNLDNEVIGIQVDDLALNEGDAGTTAFVFTVSLSAASDGAVSVDYTTADLTATAGSDYVAASGTLTIPAGSTSGTITVNVSGDTIYEPDELFAVSLTTPTNAGALNVALADSQGIGTIQNDPTDQLLVGFGAATYSVGEGDGSALLRVRLSAPAPGPVSVSYATTAGTAAAGTDYTSTSGTLSFAAGQIEQTISVPIIDDAVVEPIDDTFRVTLSAPAGAVLGRASAMVALVDNDTPPATTQLGFVQTAGPAYNVAGWNYYANSAAGYTYLRIDVPCVAGSPPLQIDLYDPAINTSAASQDTITGAADSTTFELYQMPAGWSYASGLPGAGSGVGSTTYTQDQSNNAWATFYTSAPGSCGTYLLRVETATDDVNDWGIRAGWQNAAPAQPPTVDIDGVAGSGDEITFGLQQTTLRFAQGADQCKTFYEYVRPGQAQAVFHNYDLDAPTMSARVRYYPPSATYDPLANTGGLAGTASDSSEWNNSLPATPNTRVGDIYINPEPGWWRIVTCTSDMGSQNQLIQEGQTDQASYTTQPGTPSLDITVIPSPATVATGGSLSFDVAYTNTSSGLTAGAAVGTTFTVTLPSGLAFVSCGGATCALSGSTLTVSVGTVAAGATGTVTVNTTATATGTAVVGLSLKADYSDVLGNPFVGTAGAVATIN